MYPSLLSLLAVAATASAIMLPIDVGEDGGIVFNPDSMTAAVGDVLEFRFYSGSGGHSVVASTFEAPCVPSTPTFFSGYIPGNDAGNMTFQVTVNSTEPIWFYCSLAHHCQAGMVGVINPPSGQTIDDYMMAAQNAKTSAPSVVEGGVLAVVAVGASGSSASSAASSMTSMASSMASSMSMSMSSAMSSASGSMASASSSMASATSKMASSASAASSSASAAATTKPSSAGRNSEMSTVLGLAVIAGGLVALMA